jgi:NAD(P)-dependent dehydrogenase (short-subunit alcohol dehydrogenase family)
MISGKVWFITACSSGLGLAIAREALGRGHRVAATARQPEMLADLAAAYPSTCEVLPVDVTAPATVDAAIGAVVRKWSRLDGVVNNAGYGLIGALEEVDDDQIQRCMDTNFFGTLRVTRAVLPILRNQRSGHIVNISAAACHGNYAGFSIYGAAKAGVEAMSESLRAELSPLGIGVTLVVPGPFRTEFISRSMERARGSIDDYQATSGRFGQLLDRMNGKQPGDPARAAAAIVEMVESGSHPARLYLGRYVLEKMRKRLTAMQGECAASEATAVACDFPPR